MTIFKITLKRNMKSPMCILFILLIPAVFTFLISFTKSEAAFDGVTYNEVVIVNEDKGILSTALENQLALGYNILEADESEIKNMLIEQKADVALIIPRDFTEKLLAGEIPEVECLALAVSEVPSLVKATAGSVINSLRVLTLAFDGNTDTLEQKITAWESNRGITVDIQNTEDFAATKTWLGLYSFLLMFTAFFITKPLLSDKLSGIYSRIGAAPVSPRRYMSQSLLAFAIPVCLQVVLVMLAFKYIIGFYMPNIGYLLLAGVMLALMLVGLNVMLYSLSTSVDMAIYTLIPVTTIFNMMSGTFWSREYMPEIMQKLSYVCPPFWFMNAVNNIEEIGFDYWVSILFLFGMTLLFLLFGSWKKMQVK